MPRQYAKLTANKENIIEISKFLALFSAFLLLLVAHIYNI